ncbi:MAG: hypothetical protein M3151_00810 [Actinomycetota bacterium]|nr:hypothetical protein [Actinomycetota bacterium]
MGSALNMELLGNLDVPVDHAPLFKTYARYFAELGRVSATAAQETGRCG